MSKSIVCLVAATLAVVTGLSTALAQDPVKIAPGSHKVLLDNDRVRVYEYVGKPGDKLAMHSHPAHFVYFLTPGKARFTGQDGKTTEAEFKAGDTRWSEAVTHTVDNLGPGEVRAIVVELKQ
jgi:quercetin dioxygenase-like cupin family protein